jgi:hypothetical protein
MLPLALEQQAFELVPGGFQSSHLRGDPLEGQRPYRLHRHGPEFGENPLNLRRQRRR